MNTADTRACLENSVAIARRLILSRTKAIGYIAKMIGNLIGMAIGIGAILLGGKGFTASGLPITSGKQLTDAPAKIIGIVCILIGLAFFGTSAYSAVRMSSSR